MTDRGRLLRRRWIRHNGSAALMLVMALLLVGGCGKKVVQTAPPVPELDVPPPPPRNVEPTDAQVQQPVTLVDAPVLTVERPRVAPPPPPRDVKPEPRPEPVVEAKPAEELRPAATLQTTSTDREAELERRVRAMLQAAAADLNRVDYRKLNTDVQLQDDTAKSFVRQAEDALKSKNLVFAQTMAEKAATLASQLAGR